MTSWLHEERLQAVLAALHRSDAARVLDLGCGDGDLFVRLAIDGRFTELAGLDICPQALERLRARLKKLDTCVPRIRLFEGSMTDPPPDLAGFDCAILIETIEHIEPDQLSKLEKAVFRTIRPETALITTPNAEFNALLGVPAHRMRHPDHRFEWDRARFRRWSARVAASAEYSVEHHDIGGQHPDLGGASQMAVFTRQR